MLYLTKVSINFPVISLIPSLLRFKQMTCYVAPLSNIMLSFCFFLPFTCLSFSVLLLCYMWKPVPSWDSRLSDVYTSLVEVFDSDVCSNFRFKLVPHVLEDKKKRELGVSKVRWCMKVRILTRCFRQVSGPVANPSFVQSDLSNFRT